MLGEEQHTGNESPPHLKMEEVLQKVNKELVDFKTAIDEHAIMAITDADGKITYANNKFCDISLYQGKDLFGQDHRILNSGTHPKSFFKDLWGTIKSGKVWHGEIRNKRKDGTHYWVSTTIVPFLDNSGKPKQYIALRADLTEQKLYEERLRTTAGELEKTNKELRDFKTALDEHAIVAITDAKGMITYVNDKFCDISLYDRDELIGKDHRILNSRTHAKSFFTKLWRTIESGKVWHGEIKNRRKDGTYYWVNTTIVPLLDSKGVPTQYIAIRADITAEKELEMKIVEVAEQERLSIGRDIHDDLCQRLAAIKIHCEQIAISSKNKDELFYEKLQTLVGEIGDATRLSRGIARGLSPVSMEAEGLIIGLEDLVSQTQNRFNIPCYFVCDDAILITNPTKASHIFRIAQELMTNAAKHGNATKITLRLVDTTNGVTLEVINDGVTFDMNQKRNSGGLGIHYMNYRADAIGATLEFTSGTLPGEGTRAVCTIPLSTDEKT